jgi:hypothetical protein
LEGKTHRCKSGKGKGEIGIEITIGRTDERNVKGMLDKGGKEIKVWEGKMKERKNLRD